MPYYLSKHISKIVLDNCKSYQAKILTMGMSNIIVLLFLIGPKSTFAIDQYSECADTARSY